MFFRDPIGFILAYLADLEERMAREEELAEEELTDEEEDESEDEMAEGEYNNQRDQELWRYQQEQDQYEDE